MSMAGPRRKRAPGAGNARELKVMDLLATEGWLCASRRHIGGAGDILAVKLYQDPPDHDGTPGEVYSTPEARLIEVKSTARPPWQASGFGPADRQALVETALQHGAEPLLAWWPPRGKLRWIGPSEWPNSISTGGPG